LNKLIGPIFKPLNKVSPPFERVAVGASTTNKSFSLRRILN